MVRHTDCEGVHRRDFLKIGSAGLLGLSLSNVLRLESAQASTGAAAAGNGKAKSVILVWLAGGPATIDMWDLKPEAPEGIRGEFKQADTSAAGVKISEHLPFMAKVMDNCTVVRSLAHTIPSHLPGTIFMTTGNKPTPAMQYPALGSIASKLLPTPPGVPSYVNFSSIRNGAAGGPGYLGTAYSPFEVEGTPGKGALRVRGVSLPTNVSLDDLENRNKLLDAFDSRFDQVGKSADVAAGMDKFQQQAMEILRSDKTKVAFDLERENAKVRDAYGSDAFGQGALAARRLVQAGVRFVTIGTGGWDTHNGNFQSLKTRLLPQLDKVLATLIRDLKDQGLLESTIVYCAGEFGRTPKINPRSGRDHWARSMSVVLAGGGFKGGYAHGTTEKDGMTPATEACTPDDIASTVFQQLGIDPHLELMTGTGRPMQLFREGKVVEKLLG